MILVASPSANSCSALVASVVSSSRFRLKPEPALCVLSRVFDPSNGLITLLVPPPPHVFVIIVRGPRNDTSPRELIASSHRRSPLRSRADPPAWWLDGPR